MAGEALVGAAVDVEAAVDAADVVAVLDAADVADVSVVPAAEVLWPPQAQSASAGAMAAIASRIVMVIPFRRG